MKFNKFILFLILISGLQTSLYAQPRVQYAFASKMVYYNSGGLINQSAEQLSAVSDSSCTGFTYAMKYITNYKGTFYAGLSTSKFEPAFNHQVFIKSNDGINWSPMIRTGDAPIGKNEDHSSVYAWEKNNTTNVIVIYSDFRNSNPQLRFSKSTNGGGSFSPTAEISSHNDNNYIFNGGIAGRGDTIAVCWSSRVGGSADKTWFSKSTNGGASWSPMIMAYDGSQFSYINDMEMDNIGNLYIVISLGQLPAAFNLVVRKSTDLGVTWNTMPQLTADPSPQMNIFQQLRFFNGNIYAVWLHSFNISCYYDKIFFSKTSNGGANWIPRVIVSDEDTLNAFTNNNTNTQMHPSMAVTPSGTIYTVWTDSRMKHSSNNDSCRYNVYLSRSTDGGTSWSASQLVNGPSNISRIHNVFPSLSVKSSGVIDSVLVVWSKIRNISNIGIVSISGEIPEQYSLSQNYPNPFNPVTNIKFSIPERSFVKLTVYDLLGKEIEVLVSDELTPGTYKANWDASNYPSGVYFYKLETAKFAETKKMILIK